LRRIGELSGGSLARAGVGFLRIVDRDYVELSNLQRQWLFDECDVEQGLPKAVAAARKIAADQFGRSGGAGGGRFNPF
jgi:tRNA A37 threonylcarbamoyladenosine dehydratase